MSQAEFTVARIEVIVLRAPVEKPVVASFGTIPERVAALIRVEDEQGAHGWGEVWSNFPHFAVDYRALLAERIVGPLVLGRRAADPAALWRDLSRRTHTISVQSGDQGAVSAALAGFDAAIWDMCARRAGVPLARFLGGEARPVPAYASGLNPGDGPETVMRKRAEGFRAFKQKIGFGEEIDLRNLRAIRDGMAENEALMVDVNQGWDAEEALRMAPRLTEYGLGWVEEPILADRPASEWEACARAFQAPLAGGENLRGGELLGAASGPVLDVIQPDVGKWGGVSGCFAVAQAAVEAGKRYCPHWLSGGIGLMSSAHLLAAAGGEGMLEVDANANPLRTLLATPFPQMRDGMVVLTDAPGIGVEPDLAAASGLVAWRREVKA